MSEVLPDRFLSSLHKYRFGELGIYPINPGEIFAVTSADSNYIRNKKHLYGGQQTNGPVVYAAKEQSLIALKALKRFFDKNVERGSNINAEDKSTLWQLSLNVCDDICILTKVNDQYVLSAASVCSPSSWLLSEKIGKTVAEIHQPVPELNTASEKKIDRFIEKLASHKYYERYNWGLKTTGALAVFPNTEQLPPGCIEDIHLRVERQTIFRLTKTDVVFTIHVIVNSLTSLCAKYPGLQASLKQSYDCLSKDQRRYKNIDAYKRFL